MKEDVMDPCAGCGFETAPGERIEQGNAVSPTFFHHPCHSACKALERAAAAADKAAGKGVTKHQDALKELRSQHRTKWQEKVVSAVIEECCRRGALEREQLARLVESVVQFTSCFRRRSVVMLPPAALKQYYKREFGYDSEDAEEELNKAKSDPSVRREVENGVLCYGVADFTRYNADDGARRETRIDEAKDIATEQDMMQAERKLKATNNIFDPALCSHNHMFQPGVAHQAVAVPEHQQHGSSSTPSGRVAMGLAGLFSGRASQEAAEATATAAATAAAAAAWGPARSAGASVSASGLGEASPVPATP
eukprot:9081235-Lingulodinium_polyedra.AAC.1